VNPLSPALCAAAGVLTLSLGGCATRGPTHVYWAAASGSTLHDLATASGERRTLDGHIDQDEDVLGLAYDHFTDYLFLRLSPGDVIRIVNRPAGTRVRDLKLTPEVAVSRDETAVNALDLTVRSRNRHIFAVDPRETAIVEFTLAGDKVRRITIARPPRGPIGGLGFDQRRDHLVVLFASSPAVLAEVTLEGTIVHQTNLAAAVHPVSLGCDSEAGEYFVPLAEGGIGAFDRDGRLLRTHRVPAGATPAAIGAGPRAFLRLF
jgi:hypothetical protein